MKRHRRRLPHWDAPGVPVFLTWRVRESLPPGRSFLPEHLRSGEAFVAFDRLLDSALSGPVYLRQAKIARLITDQLQTLAADGCCSLHAYVVMPNHVHLLCTPTIPLSELMHQIKGPTARRANQLLGRVGEPFWQEEYFDRLVRSEEEFWQIWRYVEWNPVKAALVSHPAHFPGLAPTG